jgi:hypothetical protein
MVPLLECYIRASHLCSRLAQGIKRLLWLPDRQVYRDGDLLEKAYKSGADPDRGGAGPGDRQGRPRSLLGVGGCLHQQ